MLKNKSGLNMRVVALAAMLFLGLAAVATAYVRSIPVDVILSAQQCKIAQRSVQARITCWHNIIAREMARSGIPVAISAFTQIYRTFPEFADSGCHFQAHRVGDLAYYSYVVAEGYDLSQIDFPDSTASCGNGFFHGFLEHLIQAKPTAEAIEDICEGLIAQQEGVNPRIRIACYHASGHGLARAERDKLTSETIDNLEDFFKHPLSECERLSEVRSIERENCTQGVLNVVVNWMSLGEYGLSISPEHPFEVCEQVFAGSTYYNQCLVEIARKIDGLSGQEPNVIIRMLDEKGVPGDLRSELIQIALAGVIQQIVGDGDPGAVLQKCTHMSRSDYLACQSGIVRGLILNGSPRSELASVTRFCRLEIVGEIGDASLCWRTAGGLLREFYDEKAHNELCQSLKGDECAYFKAGDIQT